MSEPCARWREQIDEAFVGTLSSENWVLLRAHLGECAACREVYDRLGMIDRAMAPKVDLSPFVRDRIAASVVPPQTQSARAPLLAFLTERRWIFPAFAAAAAAVIAAVLFVPKGEHYNPRGSANQIFDGRTAGVTIFCIRAGERVVATARAGDPALGPAPTFSCPIDHELQLAYSTPKSGALYLAVYGEASTGETFWYAPAKEDAQLVALKIDALDEPLPWSTRLAVKHQPGKIRLIAKFFDKNMDAGAAKRADDAVSELHTKLEITPASE